MARRKISKTLARAREHYIGQWGALGSAWGVNRTMSQIHALLMISPEAQNTDEIMAELEISRGNAHRNLQELLAWGLIRKLARKGDRKEYFEAEKDVWTVVRLIARQRRRKEIEPALAVLDECLEQTRGLKSRESAAFRAQLEELQRFTRLSDRVLEKLGREQSGKVLSVVLRFLG